MNVILFYYNLFLTNISDVPFLFPALQHSELDWEFQTMQSDQYCLAMGGICSWPRGKVLGGSSVLNAMMYVRGNRRDFDRWASLGNPGWNYDAIMQYFLKSEDMRDSFLAQSEYHNTYGYLTIEPFRSISAIASLVMEAARELGLLNPDNDVNGQTQYGFTQTQGTLRDGLRCSTAKAFLRPAAHRPNLHIALNTFVQQILINPHTKRAYGVKILRDGEEESREIYAVREVILSAGAVQSPQLLMVSGVGPAIQLVQHGIPIIQNSQGVGENLQDHIAISGQVYLIQNPISDQTLSYIVPKLINMETGRDFIFRRKGALYGMPAAEIMAFINSKYQNPDLDWPDLQIFFAAYSDIADGGIFSRRGSGVTFEYYSQVYESLIYQDAFMIIPLLMRPKSRGRIILDSADMKDPPLIFANYFDHPNDIDILVIFSFLVIYFSKCLYIFFDIFRLRVLNLVTIWLITPVFFKL